jgi:hypothetical protein
LQVSISGIQSILAQLFWRNGVGGDVTNFAQLSLPSPAAVKNATFHQLQEQQPERSVAPAGTESNQRVFSQRGNGGEEAATMGGEEVNSSHSTSVAASVSVASRPIIGILAQEE